MASASASDERGEKESVKRNANNTNGVVITVYKETVRRVSEDPTNKTKPRAILHDRRALLLAHSRELRNEASQKVPLFKSKTQSKIKKALKRLSCKEM